MSENMNEEVLQSENINTDLGEPVLEPDRNITVGDINIELCAELIQKINNDLMIAFTTDATLNDIQKAFENNDSIIYGDDSYKEYTEIVELSMRNEQDGNPYVYRVTLHQKYKEPELSDSVQFAVEYVIVNIDDEQATKCIDIFPDYIVGHLYKKDDRFKYNGKLYKVIKEHTSQADWKSDSEKSLYLEISDPSIEYPEWRQPTMAEDAYNTDDKVTYNGKKYISKINSNTWSPDEYPNGWELVEDSNVESGETQEPIEPEELVEDEYKEYIQPSGAHDAYAKGDRITFEGKHYISLIGANVYSPTAYPAGWSLVE